MLKKINLIFVLFSASFILACEDGFPIESKKNLPEGHTEQIGIAFHKNGYGEPFAYDASRGEANCAGAKCHHSDLRGGFAESDSIKLIAPSCFQCHGDLWNEIDSSLKKIKL